MIASNNLYRDPFGVLKLKRDGEEIDVRPMRAFPLSDADHYVALLDPEGNEVELIPDINALPVAPRELLLSELEKSYFLPTLVKVHDITDEFGIQRWQAETDRGPRVFEVRGREDLRWLHPGHLIIRDVDGNRYEIKRFDDLDTHSRLKIEGYL